MQVCCKINNKKNIQHFAQKFVARRANIKLKISCLVLLWLGLEWFRTLDYFYFLLNSLGTHGRCSRNAEPLGSAEPLLKITGLDCRFVYPIVLDSGQYLIIIVNRICLNRAVIHCIKRWNEFAYSDSGYELL